MKRPAFQFYPADWRKDPALSTCSLAARGLWIEMICIAHESERYGHLCVAGRAMNAQQIARSVGESPAVIAKLLIELEGAGVFARDDGGCIFSRRMVRDERLREVRASAGRLGGNPTLVGSKDKQHVGGLLKQNGEQKPTPSSSSSSSEIQKPSEPNGSAAKAAGADPPMTDEEKVFAYGVPLLVNAGNADKHARSFLAGLVKGHTAPRVVERLRECVKAKPLQPLEWLAKALPPRPPGKHAGFETRDYREGVTADGSLD